MRRWRSILITLLAAVAVVAIPLSFVYGNVLQSSLAAVLRLKVSPAFAGGEELARFRDPVGDDFGAGSLEYPLNPGFNGVHSLDVVRYTVFRPQLGVAWSNPGDFWQLALVFADLAADTGAAGFIGPVVNIYISLSEPGGSIDTVESRAELVGFDPDHSWNLVVTIDGSHDKARLRSADGQLDRWIPLLVNHQKKSLTVRLPLDDPRISKVLDGRATFHYVLVGAHDPLASGGFMTVKEFAALSSGGGASSRQTPRVFDCLVPKGSTQAGVLGSFDEATGTLAKLRPLEVPSFDPAGSNIPGSGTIPQRLGSGAANPQSLLVELEAQSRTEGQAELVDKMAKSASGGQSGPGTTLEQAIALFQAGQAEPAKSAFRAILIREPNNPRALAYQGAIIAQEGGAASSPAEAVRLVNLAYESMDRAIRLATEADQPDVWIARASVSLAVPENVFGKNRQAAADFSAAAGWAATRAATDLSLARIQAECTFKAGLALEQAGAPDEAETWFQRAAALRNAPAWVKLELARRDLLEE